MRNWLKFIFWAVLYTLWVIWLGNFWWLFGLIIVFDLHVTKKVHWAFWQKQYKEGEKHNEALDWLDALIFAVVFVTFVNLFFFRAFKIPSSSMESTLFTGDHLFVENLTYGPRLPETPLTIPFTHNVIFGKESYSTLIHKDYKRLKGFRDVRKGDIVVFGFPNGDTVLTKAPADDYYALCRFYGKDMLIDRYGPLKVRPADKKDHYVKRCVATPGDTLTIKDGLVYINGQKQTVYPGIQFNYEVVTNGQRINSKTLEKLGLNPDVLSYSSSLPGYPSITLTSAMYEEIKALPNVVSVTPEMESYSDASVYEIFPFSENYKWSRDFYGPLWIPKKGETVSLTEENLPLYERIITAYEHEDLQKALQAGSYTFKQDYYFMMGDNRHNSLDSRYWGFVPEDHIVGRPFVVWLSTDGNAKFPKNIRWRRFLKFV